MYCIVLLYYAAQGKQADVEQLKVYKAMMEKMNDAEMNDPMSINHAGKERISKASGKNVEDVSKMLFYFLQSSIMQEWLQVK